MVVAVSGCEASTCFGVAVGIRDVGFDVVDRGSVQKISALDMDDRTILRIQCNACKLHTGESDRVWAERGAGGEDADSCVSSQFWRTHGRGPFFSDCLGKFPDQPEVGVFFQPSHGFRILIFRIEMDLGFKVCQTALPWDSEFACKITFYISNRTHYAPGCLVALHINNLVVIHMSFTPDLLFHIF